MSMDAGHIGRTTCVLVFFFFFVYSIHIWCLFGNKKLARITTMRTMNIVDA